MESILTPAGLSTCREKLSPLSLFASIIEIKSEKYFNDDFKKWLIEFRVKTLERTKVMKRLFKKGHSAL